jgi:flagellar M-ring protein FliF
MQKLLAQLGEVWGRLTARQRLTVVVAVLGTLALVGTMIYAGSTPEYGVLFSDLRATDAQAIVEKLKAANVAYRLSGGGTTVSVPSERITELRLQMASSGVLTGGRVGFDLFDRSSFGATDFAQRVNYQRALEGELARTLEGMDEVETARVHITAPRESVFAEKDQPAKASVVLRVRQGRQVSRERTESVVNLLASAVEGLRPEDVAVMDARGRLLTAVGRDELGGAGRFNTQIEARQKLEMETAARIVSLLEPIVGAGRVRADVAADIDFSQVEQTDEKYNPQSAVIRSQQTSQEVRNSTASAVGGLVGARANDPALKPTPTPTPTPAPNANPANTATASAATTSTNAPAPLAGDQRSMTTTNYEIDKTVRRMVGSGGVLKRLSAAVVVDQKLVNGAPTARAADELKKLQDTVAAAIGIDAARGDQIVVQSLAFEQSANDTARPSALDKYRELILTAIKYGSFVLAALLLVLFGYRPLRRALAPPADAKQLPAAEARALPEGEAKTVAALEADAALNRAADATQTELPPAAPPGEAEVTAAPPPTSRQLMENTTPRTVAELEAEMEAQVAEEFESAGATPVRRAGAIRKQLIERSQKEPEALAATIRGWLKEKENR